MIYFDLRDWHPSVHMPALQAEVRQEGDGFVFSIRAKSMDGVISEWPPIWERRFGIDELRQAWERAHIKGHMRNDQATAMREDKINEAQWGRDYGILK